MKNFDYGLIEKGDVVGVALSGGRDSVTLLHALFEYKKTFDFDLAIINVDHSIRGEESENDSRFCEKLSKRYDLPLYFKKLDCVGFADENKMSLEEAARIKRYEFFDELIKNKKVTKIALGHHKNDNVETILFNLFRGAGTNGVSGIKKVRGNFIRPLLEVTRQEIDQYVTENALEYVEDSTNTDIEYSRNYIRSVVIPDILKKFPNALDSISRFSENISEQEEWLERIASDFVMFREEKCEISIDNIDKPVYFKAVFLALRYLGITHEVYKQNYEDLWSLVFKQNGKSVDLTRNIVATKEYDKIVLRKSVSFPYFETSIKEGEFFYQNKKYSIKRSEKREIGDNTLSFDFDKLPKYAIIRTRKNGDVFVRKSGSVKLKEYLIDKKIPKYLRDSMLFIASDSKVLGILCLECGSDLFVDESSTNIITITSKK